MTKAASPRLSFFEGQKEHGDRLVRKVQQKIEDNFRDKMTVKELADEIALSRRSLGQ